MTQFITPRIPTFCIDLSVFIHPESADLLLFYAINARIYVLTMSRVTELSVFILSYLSARTSRIASEGYLSHMLHRLTAWSYIFIMIYIAVFPAPLGFNHA